MWKQIEEFLKQIVENGHDTPCVTRDGLRVKFDASNDLRTRTRERRNGQDRALVERTFPGNWRRQAWEHCKSQGGAICILQ